MIAWTESRVPCTGAACAAPFTLRTYVQRWTGTAWVKLGPAFADGTLSPRLAIDRTGEPVFARRFAVELVPGSDPTHSDVLVDRWSGSAWQPSGEPLSVAPKLVAQSDFQMGGLAIDDKDRAVVS